jgi:hypothetical protein
LDGLAAIIEKLSKQRFFEKKRAKNFCERGALGPGLRLIATKGGD